MKERGSLAVCARSASLVPRGPTDVDREVGELDMNETLKRSQYFAGRTVELGDKILRFYG